MKQGLVHLYCGEGKGKTTAAMGLALRALGHGEAVVIVQFFKGRRNRRAGRAAQAGGGDPAGQGRAEICLSDE